MGNLFVKRFDKKNDVVYSQVSIGNTTQEAEKKIILRRLLTENLLECDIKWTLFVAAAFSCYYHTKLRPFPMYRLPEPEGADDDILGLLMLIADIPPLHLVPQFIIYPDLGEVPLDALILLHWVLVKADYPEIRVVPNEVVSQLLAQLGYLNEVPMPTHVFEIRAKDDAGLPPPTEKPHLLHYYTSKLEDFYSILSNGFRLHYSNVYGSNNEPIDMKSKLKECYESSPICPGWGKSRCGPFLSCIAVCRYILMETETTRDRKGNEEKIAGAGDVQQERDDACIQVDYLFIYSRRNEILDKYNETNIKITSAEKQAAGGEISRWVKRRNFGISLMFCVGLVVSVGLIHNHCGQHIKQAIIVNGRGLLNRMF